MKGILLASALALGAMTTGALAETVTLTNTQMDGVRAGAITQLKKNPAGNTTQGNGQAITTTNVNPTGKAPNGQNK
jgi:hypothetical protein